MAIVVEDGSGLVNAESFSSIADVTDYLERRNRETAWLALSEAEQEAKLRDTTDYLVNKYRGQWRGWIVSTLQSLPFPRLEVVDEEGRTLTGVPDILIACQCELINLAMSDPFVDVVTASAIKRERDKLDVLESEVEYVGGKSTRPKYVKVHEMIKPLLKTGSGSRLVRG